ncbi:ATP-dependent DNA helicase [Spirosoma lituiforme]
MPRTFNIQDPDDLIRLRYAFENYSVTDWRDYLEFTNHVNRKLLFSYDDRGCLIDMVNHAERGRIPVNPKRIVWALSLVDKIDLLKKQLEVSTDIEEQVRTGHVDVPQQHFTFRVAWHDNRWNGKICNDPSRNRFCSGYHSLLSERLRKRKFEHLEQEIEHKSQPVTPNYVPPCFWSINVFGEQSIIVQHDNPAEKRLNPISEQLPPYSMFSWPFSVAFTRSEEQIITEGAYPRNLESVRIPRFRGKVHNEESIGFIYAKFSNPLTEEEQQYLVVGCGIITAQGSPTTFGPREIIDEKRKKPRNRNFPEMNWALRFSFDPDRLVRMPYHEYLDFANRTDLDENARDKDLNRIKVAIHEPELQHCFKYVAMDVDDDEAIFILSKMRQKLLECLNDGIVSPVEMQQKLDKVESLLEFCWHKRGYFPGFTALSRALLNWDKPEFPLGDLLSKLRQDEPDYANKLLELLKTPTSDPSYKIYKSSLIDLREAYQDKHDLSTTQFLNLCLLNLKPTQFKRILEGKLKLPKQWFRSLDSVNASTDLTRISDNPYLLYEEYDVLENNLDPITGEETDSPIDLFKIDIAYFPDTRFGIKRLDLQREMRSGDKRRLRAIVLRYLRTLESTGHCFADGAELEEAVKDYPLFYNFNDEYKIPPNTFVRLKSDYENHFEENPEKLKVIAENDTYYFYLNSIYQAERNIESVVGQLLKEDDNTEQYSNVNTYIDTSCQQLQQRLGSHFDEQLFREERTRLYRNIFLKRFYILSGNAGSGKSYELLNILTNLKQQGQSYLLLAPTGKAALRLKNDPDYEGIEAITIDKLIAEAESNQNRSQEIRNINNLVVDEMSMVDLVKCKRLFDLFEFRRPSFKRLIFVGDPNQLPPIGYGKVLKDIIYYLKSHPEYKSSYIELQANCRNELAESQILDLSEGFVPDGDLSDDLLKRIKSGKPDISKGLRIHYWQTEVELYNHINAEFDDLCNSHQFTGTREERMNQLFRLLPNGAVNSQKKPDLDRLQLITPYNADFWGTGQLNDFIQEHYKSSKELALMNNRFKQADKIIRTKNYYERNKLVLSNGSIGLIRMEGKQEVLYFPELKEPMPLNGESGIRSSDREDFDLAYAISVHKAQGSGFNHVFLILPKKLGLLSKELVYTALTRSKESVTLFVQGSFDEPFGKGVLDKARSRSFTESRRTTLLLPKPFKFYALEADGTFIESRVELLIYQALKAAQNNVGEADFTFSYEEKPFANGTEVPIKTDFTIRHQTTTWYWEHLGRLGNKRYEQTWQEVKKPTYKSAGLYEQLLTTDERSGIDPAKIDEIIRGIVSGNVSTEDRTERYSSHHFSLR